MTKDNALLWCMEEIHARAKFMGLRWKVEDVVQANCGEGGTVIFLRRFNPQIRTDELGNPVLDDAGQPVHEWRHTIWTEQLSKMDCRRDGDGFVMSFPLPRLVCQYPELIFNVSKNGEIKGKL